MGIGWHAVKDSNKTSNFQDSKEIRGLLYLKRFSTPISFAVFFYIFLSRFTPCIYISKLMRRKKAHCTVKMYGDIPSNGCFGSYK